VILSKKGPCNRSLSRNLWNSVLGPTMLAWLSLLALPGVPALAQSGQPPVVHGAHGSSRDTAGTGASTGEQLPDHRMSGNISGTVIDRTGAVVAGSRVRLTHKDQTPSQEVLSGDNGQFSFANVAPGPFQITITWGGFAAQASS
jgi:hypothetical protein